MAFENLHYPPKPHKGCKTTVWSCHKCRAYAIAEAIRRGERVADADREEARTACIKCRGGADISDKGENILRLGAFAAPDEFIESEADEISLQAAKSPRTEPKTPLPLDIEAVALELLRTFAALPLPVVAYLHGALNGKQLSVIARERGTTKQCISQSVKKARAQFPFLEKVAPQVMQAARSKLSRSRAKKRHALC